MLKFLRFAIPLLLMLFICNQLTPRSNDPFYTDDGGGLLDDYGRFPLIKPYDAFNVTTWSIELHALPSETELHVTSLWDITTIAVENNVIMVYAAPMTDVNEGYAWFVLVPDQTIEVGFENETDFLEYIQEYGIETPDWEDPTVLFQEFTTTGCLDWIPDCE